MPPIPDRIRRFIATSVPSVPWVEALLILREPPLRAWNCASLAARLYVGPARSQELLEALAAAGIARREGTADFLYAPPEALAPILDEFALLYATQLVEVTEIIHNSVDRRAVQFADAFRIRKEVP